MTDIRENMLPRLEIELINGRKLVYGLLPGAHRRLDEWSRQGNEDEATAHVDEKFLRVGVIPLRSLFVRMTAIKRFAIRWYFKHEIIDPLAYIDNFDTATPDFKAIPDFIILINGVKDPLIYWKFDTNDYFSLDDDFNIERISQLRIMDSEGEDNFIPTCNIDLMEIKWSIVYAENDSDYEDD